MCTLAFARSVIQIQRVKCFTTPTAETYATTILRKCYGCLSERTAESQILVDLIIYVIDITPPPGIKKSAQAIVFCNTLFCSFYKEVVLFCGFGFVVPLYSVPRNLIMASCLQEKRLFEASILRAKAPAHRVLKGGGNQERKNPQKEHCNLSLGKKQCSYSSSCRDSKKKRKCVYTW